MTSDQHNRYVAYAFFANAGFYLLLTIVLVVMMYLAGVFTPPRGPRAPMIQPGIFGFTLITMAIINAIFAIPSAVGGYAVLKKRSWARTASIVAAVIAGMNFPIGTAACVYALWFFFGENWKEVYTDEQFVREPRQIAYGVETQRAAYEEAERTGRETRFDPYNPPDWR